MKNSTNEDNYVIPKVIYQTWKTQNLPKKISNLHKKMLSLNPGYEHIIYTDEQMNDYISSNASKEIRNLYWQMNHIVAKADIWRYTVLYNNGGIYLDIDSQITNSIDDLIKGGVEGVVSAETNENLFVQWGLIFNQNHKILEETLNNILRAVKEKRYINDHHSLTVKTYAEAIFNVSKINGTEVSWSKINNATNEIINVDNSNFRLYGVDYNNYFSFKHKYNHLLRERTKGSELESHWSNQQKVSNVYKV